MLSCSFVDNMSECTQFIESFDIFTNGNKKVVSANDKEFETLKLKVNNLFNNSRVMPAFGVSLHLETLNALKSDEWLQINFNQELNQNGLIFSSLLFKLEETNGINLIRKYNGEYEGRCIFLDFIQTINLKQFIL